MLRMPCRAGGCEQLAAGTVVVELPTHHVEIGVDVCELHGQQLTASEVIVGP